MNQASHFLFVRQKIVRVVLGIIAGAVILLAAWYTAPAWLYGRPIYPPYIPGFPTPAQQKAIDAARQWRGSQEFLSGFQVFTHAVDPKTGARYTFPDSDLPPGWVEEN